MDKQKQKKNDLWLILGVLALAGVFLLWQQVTKTAGGEAVAYVSGKEAGRWPLSRDCETVIESAKGQNTLVIAGGRAKVTEASCPDGLCVSQGAVDSTNQTIVCLPNELVIQIEGTAGSGGLTVG